MPSTKRPIRPPSAAVCSRPSSTTRFHLPRCGFSITAQKDFNITADNGRAWQLDLIAEANRKLRTQAALSEKVLEKATIKSLADRVRNYQTSQGMRFNNQHWVRGTYYAALWRSMKAPETRHI